MTDTQPSKVSNEIEERARLLLEEHRNNKGKRLKILITIFTIAMTAMIALYVVSPQLSKSDKQILFRFPREPKDLSGQLEVILKYKQENPILVTVVWCYLYIFLQSFAIPGPIFLSIIAGPLYGVFWGMVAIAFSATTGASICYLLSQSLVKGFVIEFKPTFVAKFSKLVKDNSHRLPYFMIFLRLTPLVPNWFVNLSSPIAGIPLHIFAGGTFLGLMPFNYIHVNTGLALNNITKFGASAHQILLLGGLSNSGFLSILMLLPTILTKGKKLDDSDAEPKDKKEK